MRVTHIAAVSLLAVTSYGSPLFTSDDSRLVTRQVPGSYYAVTGATGGVFPRLEIRELQKKGGEMWNLFLLALAEFQAMDQTIIDSYYQIAGIHGMPWASWDGVEGTTEGKNDWNRGYCPHAQVLFGTWHRPYLVLFEQKLQSVAKAIANRFPTASKATYQDAATKLRIPFWDWAKAIPTTEPMIPEVVSAEKVQVTFPNGTSAQIGNPLFQYNFHPLDNTQINGTGCPAGRGEGGRPIICDTYNHTIRGGTYESGGDTVGVNTRLRADLQSNRASLYAILSQYQTFTQVAANSFCGEAARVGNLETLHNNIHADFTPGHMTPPAVAAFDPIFWLHHANVDRHLAIHQALYPNTYLTSCAAEFPTYTIEIGEILDANSALTPFHKNAAGDFWTSAAAREIRTQGYTYPELANNPSNATLVKTIKDLYSGPADVPVTATKTVRNTKRQGSEPTEKELYLAEIKLPTCGLDDGQGGGAPYSVLIFLGDVGNDAKDWITSDSFVGATSTLGAMIPSDQVTTATIDLSFALEKAIAGGLTSAEKAKEYLKANLHYRLAIGEVEIPKKEVANLNVGLISTKVEIAQSDDEFDRWVGGFMEHGTVEA
ncbi:Di-copper centre-containing protein [Lentithecium fluviatile CBS 122367]|uniref:tyrosinase n=1 Tax=Lentithecium fluviatile CBS 122367 TaxID=1168545 RepID=A0A6G1JIY4_9PLEO|nr:Di-copper centre-containing protein [Lentithecium fluviatile CBS 122367]